MSGISRIAVLGAGSWGTALACHLAKNQISTRLWGRDAVQLAAMASERVNVRYLPDQPLPDSLHCTGSLSECLDGCEAVLIATPSHTFRDTLSLLKKTQAGPLPIIWSCKGLEAGSGRLLSVLARETLGDQWPLAVISGPTFAREIMREMPAAITVAAEDDGFARQVIHCLHSNSLRAYRSDDLIGVQIGGALKNVFAIAAGASDGLGYGANARAALLTRSLAELMRLGAAMGGRRETLMGLAGAGDMILSCTDDLSRNRRMGLALARGLSPQAARDSIGQAVEGIGAACEAHRLAQQHDIEMPISEQVYSVLYEDKVPQNAVRELLQRAPRSEADAAHIK